MWEGGHKNEMVNPEKDNYYFWSNVIIDWDY